MALKGGGDSGDWAEKQEQERQAKIAEGRKKIAEVFGQFDDDFYAGQRQAAVDFYTPQEANYYDDARKRIAYALARQGVSESTVAGENLSNLEEARRLGLQGVASKATDIANERRRSVEDERAALEAELLASGDPAMAANAASARSQYLAADQEIRSLDPLYTNVGATLAGMLRPTYDEYGRATGPAIRNLWSAPTSSTSRVVSA